MARTTVFRYKGREVDPQTIGRDLSVRLGAIYAGLGDKDRAFEWFERAYEERSALMAFLKVDPGLKTIRADARFADLLRRVGFAN